MGKKEPKPLHSHDRSPIKYFLQIKEHYRVNMKDYSKNVNLIFEHMQGEGSFPTQFNGEKVDEFLRIFHFD